MIAHANKEAVEKTLTTGLVHYWSTGRKKLWKKGETSGNVQHLKKIYVDCDSDALLLQIHQEGAACHLGYPSCFFRRLENGKMKIVKRSKGSHTTRIPPPSKLGTAKTVYRK